MLPLAMVNGYDTTLSQLSTAALADLRALMASLEGVAPDRAQRVLQEAFPEVFNPYAAAASAVSASFYEEVREFSEARGRFDAETLDAVDGGRWGALVGFGTAPSVFERGGQALAFSLLSGGLTRVLTEIASDTIIGNAANEDGVVGYQRVPKPGCCGFCGMLASRTTSLYQSKEAAEQVVGRGTPVREPGTKRRRGAVAKGIRPRGSRKLGQEFHDHCGCKGVPVFAGQEVQMQKDAGKYLDAYNQAKTNIDKGLAYTYTQYKSPDGSLKNKYRWVDREGETISPKERVKMIAQATRVELGVK